MNIETLQAYLKENKLTKVEYYTLLLNHLPEIFESIGQEGKIATAQKLHMSPQIFSTFHQIALAHSRILAEQTTDSISSNSGSISSNSDSISSNSDSISSNSDKA